MPKIKIQNSGKLSIIDIPKGNNLFRELRSQGFEVYSPCGGNGSCGKCKVYIKGEGNVTSCLYLVEKDIEIILPDPVEAKILTSQYEHSRVLPFNPGEIANISFYPFGVAIDIGTTSLVFYFVQLIGGSLLETRAVLNPQAKYGADVISRINHCILNKDGLTTLQSELIQTINTQLSNFAEKTGISTDEIVKISVSGNSTMLHLLLGVNPESLAFAPFTPVFTEEKIVKAASLNLDCNREGEVKLLPSVTAYVGADIVAGIASIAPSDDYKNYLFVDIGTNGEMALITPDKIYSCATAAGPAFEGASIECGMGAVEGAISVYDDVDSYQTIDDSKAKGICGSGLIDIVAALVKLGNVKPDGLMDKDFVILKEDKSSSQEAIKLTQKDIREVQLAKSAIAAGMKILIQQAGLSIDDLDALYLAGGFGNYIRIQSAIDIGLIPKELEDKVIPVGNTSGTGAMLALNSVSFDDVISSTLEKMHYIELSDHEDFVLEFAMNMEFTK